MARHFSQFADDVQRRYLSATNDPFVVEIGSNDGILLQNFKNLRHLGIEPSANVAAVAQKKGLQTITKFFNENTALSIVKQFGQADAFLGANVMCHIPTLHSVITGLKTLLGPKGIIAFEDPYIGDVIENTSYDQFYDEHVFLFSASSVSYVFSQHGFELIDVLPQPVHGGSMRYYLGHKGAHAPSSSVVTLLEKEAKKWAR